MAYMPGSELRGYKFTSRFHGMGQSAWAYATKAGKEYFVKRFLSPVYPEDFSLFSSDDREELLKNCAIFESRHRKIMTLLQNKTVEGGNLVVAHEFFREGAYFFKITEKIDNVSVDIRSLDNEQCILFFKTMAHSLRILHSVGVVHGDLKPGNILLKKKSAKSVVAKLIDFDDSYFAGDPPSRQDIVGTANYFSPETGNYVDTGKIEGSNLTQKSDIFALGLIYVEYLTGDLPYFDQEKYIYPYQAVLAGESLGIDKLSCPAMIRELIQDMLVLDFEHRPTIDEVFYRLSGEKPSENHLKGDLAGKLSSSSKSKGLKGSALGKK